MKQNKMNLSKKILTLFVCIMFSSSNVLALNVANDLLNHTSGVNPVTNGNITNITTTHPIDTYHWSSFNLGSNESANFIFQANGQTALNYLSPGANPSAIFGTITGSGAKGNILLFNPNGIMMGNGASVSGANTFFASTNKFDGIVNGKVTFSEAEKNNPLSIGNIKFNDVNNAHFVAPNVSIKADSLNTANSVSFRAIGGGEYDVNTNLFSNEVSVKSPISKANMLDINANLASNKITIEAKADADSYATALISGEIQANKAVTGENGEIYIIAANDNNSANSGIQIVQNALIKGNGATVKVDAQNYVQNGDIDVSGNNGGKVSINTKSFDQNANISAKGTDGNGGNVAIKTTNYVAVGDTNIDASGATKGGTIDIQGDYQILSSGSYNASSSKGAGGTVKISAPLTKLYGVDINASGNTEGGQVYIGGAGTSGIEITDSYLTMLNDGSIINVTSSGGKGGSVYIDSKGDTYAFGTINASGISNKGGYIELCGDESLNLGKNINAGLGGTIYLDPKNIIISDSNIGDICYNMLFSDGIPINVSLDLAKGAKFGSSMAIYNNLLAVGAEGTGSTSKGAAYLFYFDQGTTFSNLTLFKTLSDGVKVGSTQLTLSPNANFGSAIALTNKLLAIGASGENSGDGKVLLFDFTPDTKYTSLKYDTSKTGDAGQKAFGSSLALHEYTSGTTYNLLAVGAQGASGVSGIAGKEYLYSFNYASSADPYSGFSLETSFPGTSSAPGDYFGSSSALSTITIGGTTHGLFAVGASGNIPVEGGSVYLYQFDLATPSILTPKLTINDNTVGLSIFSGDAFGSAVALMPILSGGSNYDLVAIGSEGRSSNGGGVYYLSIDSTYGLQDNGGIYRYLGEQLGSAVAFGQTPTISPTYALLALGLDTTTTGAYSDSGKIYLYTFTPNTKYSGTNFVNEYYADSTVKGVQTLSASDLFGSSVALYKNLLAIGARGDATGGAGSGAVYLYGFNSGTLYQNLTLYSKLAHGSNVLDTSGNTYTLNINSGDSFGFSTALQDGLLAVGSTGADAAKGAAYLFNFNSGTNYSSLTIDKILNSTDIALTAGDHFGSGIALSNNLLAVGAEYTVEGLNNKAGAVYLFNFENGGTSNPFNTITLQKKLQSIPGTYTLDANDNFGNSVSLYNNQLAVGAYAGSNLLGTDTGSVYLFNVSSPSTPTYETVITSVAGSTLKNFGSSVSLYDNILGVGDMTSDSNEGSAYLFTISNNNYSSPVFNKKLQNGTVLVNNAGGTYPLDLTGLNQFGCSISIYEKLLAIGAQLYSAGTGGANAGGVYLLNFQGAYLGDYIFNSHPSSTLYLSPTQLANWLSLGSVTLQANGDIRFYSSLLVTSGVGNTLKLQAGKSVTISGDITTNNGDLEVIANETLTAGVVNADRDPGAAQISMASGKTINTGSGDVSLKITGDTGKTNHETGGITLENVTANSLTIENAGLDTGSNIVANGVMTIAGPTSVSATSANDITMANSNNDFGGAVKVLSGNNATIKDVNDITIDTSTVSNLFDLTAGGAVTLNSINGTTISVLGTDDVTLNLGTILTATGLTNPLVLSSSNGNIINNSDANALATPNGRWLLYSGNPDDTTLGGLVPANTYFSSTVTNPVPADVPAGDSVLYRTPNPNPGGGGGGGATGAIVGGTVGGAAAAGAAAGTVSGLGLLPGLLLGLASPIQFDETMIDIICNTQQEYPLLVRNIQYVYQTDDVCKLDPDTIGSAKFIPDATINNGSYELVKVKIPPKFANAPKGITVKITQKSQPFKVSKNVPDMNFNVFNKQPDQEIGKIYETRRFLKSNYMSKRVATIANEKVIANKGIVQKTIAVKSNETNADLSIVVNYLKDGKFPGKNSPERLEKQAYSFVIQFIENK